MKVLDIKKLKGFFDNAVKAERFNERKLFAETEMLRQYAPIAQLDTELGKILPPAQVEVIHRRIVRNVYFIELVKGDITSTKYDVRWTSRFLPNDTRKTSFEECVKIHETLSSEFISYLAQEVFRTELKLVVEWGLSPQEIPLDYESKDVSPIHSATNLKVLSNPDYSRLLQIRRAFLDPKINPDFQLFAAILDKIRVKSYLTDRALTGDFKTNREKRWEAHPHSHQFAFRRDCLNVELELLDQLVRFRSFPKGTIQYLQSSKLVNEISEVSKCPVTLDELDFEVIAQECSDPIHGKSAYQVGHLNPLKAGESNEFRHHRKNISWITSDGNRIQGHLTLKETRELLLRISKNYERLIISKST